MPETTTPQLTESDVEAIEARANAASPSYCVDWEKGDHALLQAGGWRPANEEQPRTVATFDKDDGYVDLLFCAEARTDIPALIRDWRALTANLQAHREAMGAFKQVLDKREEENTALHEQFAEIEQDRLTLIYWLLRAYNSGHREGWEEGPSTDETMHGLLCVLANRGYDPNLSDDAKVLLKTKPRY